MVEKSSAQRPKEPRCQEDEARTSRLADALRANLARRKAQQRARAAAGRADAEGTVEP